MQVQRRKFSVALVSLIGAAWLPACTLVPPKPVPVISAALPAPSVPVPIVANADVVPVPAPAPAPAAVARRAAAAPPPPPLRTAIIVSDDIPEHAAIVAEILERDLDDVSVHHLAGLEGNATRVIAELEGADPDRLIAVGLLAATVARAVPGVPAVFCQVYNYPDHDLLSATSKGIFLLPPYELQLRDWRLLAPDLAHVGVITGPGQEPLLDRMRAAAGRVGVTLHVRTVASDREALMAFKDLVPSIQGLTLLPDNRVLSPAVVTEIMAYGARHSTQIAVFGENLLDFGALLSFRSDPRDVVDRILAQLGNVGANGVLAGPDMLPLTKLLTTVNLAVAEQLGLVVPERLAGPR